MKSIYLFITLLMTSIPVLGIINNYIDVHQIKGFESNVTKMEDDLVTYKSEVMSYSSGSNPVDLKPGVYDVSKNKSLLRKVGIYDDYVEVLSSNSSLSYDYAAKTYADVVDHVLKSVNKSMNVIDKVFNLILNVTQSYPDEFNSTQLNITSSSDINVTVSYSG